VAQHNVQTFLRQYQELRKITVLLTSHYMKDVAALCRRAVIISEGTIIYDGSLSGIVDRFSGHKIVTLLFADGTMPPDLDRFGEVTESRPPRAKLRIDRAAVTEVLASVLATCDVEDVSVEDPPLEEVISQVFARRGIAAPPPPDDR
jgi:ABC-2 type transport system ATP-binding protein